MTDIILCPNDDTNGGKDIEFCHEREIELCVCDYATGLTLDGNSFCVDGSQYSVTGAIGDVSFFISCGHITSDGIVYGVDDCEGSGKITVVDGCGQVAVKDISFGTYAWVRYDQFYDGEMAAGTAADARYSAIIDDIRDNTDYDGTFDALITFNDTGDEYEVDWCYYTGTGTDYDSYKVVEEPNPSYEDYILKSNGIHLGDTTSGNNAYLASKSIAMSAFDLYDFPDAHPITQGEPGGGYDLYAIRIQWSRWEKVE